MVYHEFLISPLPHIIPLTSFISTFFDWRFNDGAWYAEGGIKLAINYT